MQHQWKDEPGEGGLQLPDRGAGWLNNDLVNLISNLFVTILAGFLLYFCGKEDIFSLF